MGQGDQGLRRKGRLKRARPDGYTLLMGSVTPNSINGHPYSRLGFDTLKDFVPIALVASTPNILVVQGNSPMTSVHEVIAHANRAGATRA